jgi:hypothetical protein
MSISGSRNGHEAEILILFKFDWFRAIRWAKALIIFFLFFKLIFLGPGFLRKIGFRRKVLTGAMTQMHENCHFTGYF